MSIKNTNFSHDEIYNILCKKSSVYFIGIGGVSMSCLALMTQKLGYKVSGSDRVASKITKQLEKQNITVNYNHSPENIIDYDVIVYTVAISENNPEYLSAMESNKPCISRADFLGYLMTHYKNRIGVSGMHGKSTTSSMISEVFLAAELDPTIVLGAELPTIDGCYKNGGEDFFIFESCEYMDSFLSFNPTLEVILNIELDHTDYFPNLEAVKQSFSKYLNISTVKTAVLNYDDDNILEISNSFNEKIVSFGIDNKSADFRAENITYDHGKPSFDLYYKNIKQGRISLSVFGKHNILNALAVCATSYEHGIAFKHIEQGLKNFTGAKRRMEKKGTLSGVEYFEDYAHHPTEIKASLNSARVLTNKKVWCVFQSHTYSRTSELFEDFAEALNLADNVIVLDIYAARETDTRGVSGNLLAQKIGEKATYADCFEKAAVHIKKHAQSGDIAIIMGAGDVFHVFDYISFDK